MDKDTIKGILAKYSPPLSPGQMDMIADDFLHMLRSERAKRARRKTKETAEKPKVEAKSEAPSQTR